MCEEMNRGIQGEDRTEAGASRPSDEEKLKAFRDRLIEMLAAHPERSKSGSDTADASADDVDDDSGEEKDHEFELPSDEDADQDDKDDEDDEDSDEDADDNEDDDEDDDEDDTEDDDEEDDESGADSKDSVGHRVILRSDFKSNKAYCDAVVQSMKAVLSKNGIHENPHRYHDDVQVFVFDKSLGNADIDCHLLIEYEICNYRLEFKFNDKNRPGRTPLIDFFCQERNFMLRYGGLTMNHEDGEKKLEYSSCFYGAFSEEAFDRYWQALYATLHAYSDDYWAVACGKKLDAEQRKQIHTMLGELAANLSGQVKPEQQATYDHVLTILGNDLPPKYRKLLAYLVKQC